MSIYLGKSEVGVTLLNDANPIGIEEIGNHTFASGDIIYNGTRLYACTFARTPITSFYGPNVKRFNHVLDPNTDGSGIYTFMGCTELVSVNFPELLNMGTSGSSQFSGCSSLITLRFPKLTSFPSGGYVFYQCTSLTDITATEFPSLTTFNAGGYQFAGCTSLTTVNIPNLTAFGGTGHQFDGCTNLTTVNLPKLTSLGNGGYQFQNCKALTSVNLPLATGAPGNYCFSGCTSLQHIFLPKFTASGTYAFNGCSNLLTAVLLCKGGAFAMGGNTFRGCSKLTSVDLANVTQIKANEFINSAALNMLVLRRTSMTTLANVSAFSGTPFASGKAGGTLYVPESLVDTYKAGTNWVTILGYGSGEQNQIKSIESTHEDPDAPIDLTLYYADGTAIT